MEEADELDGNRNLKSMIPEPTANVHEASWTGPFSVINTTTATAMRTCRLISRGWTKGIWQDVYLVIVQCQRCRTSTYCGHPRIREPILTMAARLAEEGNPVTDPHANFFQFRKDIAYATVCNKRIIFGEALLKALSRCGVVRVSRDLVNQIFMGNRGRKYTVIREEFFTKSGDRFAYRVAKTTGMSSTKTTSR